MLFSVIYEVDTCKGESIRDYAPPRSRAWQLTEQEDGHSEYSYLGGKWDKGKHRKWVSVLTKRQFNAFVHHCQLQAEDVETMGSLGAPGCGFGIAPAISFRGEHYGAITSAYVTPLAEHKGKPIRKGGATERDWKRIRSSILANF